MSKNLSKEEIQLRKEQEARLRGGTDDITPSYYLDERQQEVFDWLVSELEASDMLSNLDSPNLSAFAFALVQLEHCNDMINRNPNNLFDKQLMSSREKLVKEVQRYTNEFCLSPQSRAKVGNANIQKKEKATDPLLTALKVMK
jgi:P27 family predicted phage terminase small subunit